MSLHSDTPVSLPSDTPENTYSHIIANARVLKAVRGESTSKTLCQVQAFPACVRACVREGNKTIQPPTGTPNRR